MKKRSPATKKSSELQKRMSAKTDKELISIVYLKTTQYSSMALEIAQMILKERNLDEKTIKKYQGANKRKMRLQELREKKETKAFSFFELFFEFFWVVIVEGLVNSIGRIFD